MRRTDGFRKQHDEMLEVVKEISSHLDINNIEENIVKVRSLFITLVGKLSVHLIMEDKSLYPQLLNHDNEEIKTVAQKFINEMGNISNVLDEYKKEWIQSGNILDRPQDFIDATHELFSALGNRIERENNELYRLVDDLEVS